MNRRQAINTTSHLLSTDWTICSEENRDLQQEKKRLHRASIKHRWLPAHQVV